LEKEGAKVCAAPQTSALGAKLSAMEQVRGPHVLPPEKFPILVEFLHPDTRAVVYTITIPKPRGPALSPIGSQDYFAKVRIPPIARMLGHPVVARITFGDGTVQVIEPPASK
jgi:hypothetical protein